MDIRADFKSVEMLLNRLVQYASVFTENNLEKWPHYKNDEDFHKIYKLDNNSSYSLESLYGDGRDLASFMELRLTRFNDVSTFPTLKKFVDSFENGWIYEIEKLKISSQQYKNISNGLDQSIWAVKKMIELYDEQISLLVDVKRTIDALRNSELYKFDCDVTEDSEPLPSSEIARYPMASPDQLFQESMQLLRWIEERSNGDVKSVEARAYLEEGSGITQNHLDKIIEFAAERGWLERTDALGMGFGDKFIAPPDQRDPVKLTPRGLQKLREKTAKGEIDPSSGGKPSAITIPNLIGILRESITVYPANAIAFGVVGVGAGAALVLAFMRGSVRLAIFAPFFFICFMVLLAIFTRLHKGASPVLRHLATALACVVFVAFSVVLGLCVSSFGWGVPKHATEVIFSYFLPEKETPNKRQAELAILNASYSVWAGKEASKGPNMNTISLVGKRSEDYCYRNEEHVYGVETWYGGDPARPHNISFLVRKGDGSGARVVGPVFPPGLRWVQDNPGAGKKDSVDDRDRVITRIVNHYQGKDFDGWVFGVNDSGTIDAHISAGPMGNYPMPTLPSGYQWELDSITVDGGSWMNG